MASATSPPIQLITIPEPTAKYVGAGVLFPIQTLPQEKYIPLLNIPLFRYGTYPLVRLFIIIPVIYPLNALPVR